MASVRVCRRWRHGDQRSGCARRRAPLPVPLPDSPQHRELHRLRLARRLRRGRRDPRHRRSAFTPEPGEKSRGCRERLPTERRTPLSSKGARRARQRCCRSMRTEGAWWRRWGCRFPSRFASIRSPRLAKRGLWKRAKPLSVHYRLRSLRSMHKLGDSQMRRKSGRRVFRVGGRLGALSLSHRWLLFVCRGVSHLDRSRHER